MVLRPFYKAVLRCRSPRNNTIKRTTLDRAIVEGGTARVRSGRPCRLSQPLVPKVRIGFSNPTFDADATRN
jgi:hypothetical protein